MEKRRRLRRKQVVKAFRLFGRRTDIKIVMIERIIRDYIANIAKQFKTVYEQREKAPK